MDIFNLFTFIGGISLFLFGMKLLSQALEKKAGGKMSGLLSRFTSNKYSGFLLGTFVTALMQSSSATTVMVVGLVNAGVLTLSQSIGITIGANLGTTITAWILSLNAVAGETIWVKLVQPDTFVPVLAFIGIILFAFVKSNRKKDVGMICLSFAVLMFGMDAASGAVSGLGDIPSVQRLFLAFSNPVLGILVGAALTAVLQSSSVSIGILQAFCMTGQVSIGAAVPIILGQNIGACVPTLAAAIGAGKQAKKTAVVRLNFNILSATLNLLLYFVISRIFSSFAVAQATPVRVAILHSAVNLISAMVFLPLSSLLEKSASLFVRSEKEPELPRFPLDERLFNTPGLAIDQARATVARMAEDSVNAFTMSTAMITDYDEKTAKKIAEIEAAGDLCEDAIDTYLVKLTTYAMSEKDSRILSLVLHVTAGFERISDHAVHLAVYGRRLSAMSKGLDASTLDDLGVITSAVLETLNLTLKAFRDNDYEAARNVEPLEQVVDELTKAVRKRRDKLDSKNPAPETEVIFSDILSVLERVSDHCSDMAAGIIEIHHGIMDLHGYVKSVKKDENLFYNRFEEYLGKYKLKDN